MTVTINKTTIYKSDHSTFGGVIYENDFNTNFSKEKRLNRSAGSSIASRIERDKRFDEQCRRLYETRKNYKKMKEV